MELATGALAAVGGKLAYDVLGPTASYLGGELKGLAEVGVRNIKRVFEKAQSNIKDRNGTVPPRVMYPLLQSAYFCDDEVVASYLGGVLASSRVLNLRDDRAIGFIKLIDGLSSYALRLHCLIYTSIIAEPLEPPENLFKWMKNGHGVTVLFDESDLAQKMDLAEDESISKVLDHSFVSLEANSLTFEGHRSIHFHDGGIDARFCRLTLRGVELYCWGMGNGQKDVFDYFSNRDILAEMKPLIVRPLDTKLGTVSWG